MNSKDKHGENTSEKETFGKCDKCNWHHFSNVSCFVPPKPMNDEQIIPEWLRLPADAKNKLIIHIKLLETKARLDERKAMIEKIKGIIGEDDKPQFPANKDWLMYRNQLRAEQRQKLAQLEKEGKQ